MSDPTQNPPPEEGSTPPRSTSGEGSYGTGAVPPPQPGESQQPGAMPPPRQGETGGGVGQPADLMPRFVARLIDYIMLALVEAIVFGLVAVGMVAASRTENVTTWGNGAWPLFTVNPFSSVISAAIALLYFTLMEGTRGQTVGKMLLKLETRGPGGGRPTMEQSLRRNAFTGIGILGVIPFLGFVAGLLSLAAVIAIAVTISNDTATHRGWHDNFAGGTTVVRVG